METSMHEGESFKLMIEKAHIYVERANNMRSMLQAKAALALEWYNSVSEVPSITDK
jgi:hypothetical protein